MWCYEVLEVRQRLATIVFSYHGKRIVRTEHVHRKKRGLVFKSKIRLQETAATAFCHNVQVFEAHHLQLTRAASYLKSRLLRVAFVTFC